MRDMNQVILNQLQVLLGTFDSIHYYLEELQNNGKLTLKEWLSVTIRIKEAEYEAFNVINKLAYMNEKQEDKHE